MEELLTYFPKLDDARRARFAALGPLYREWNERINVVSRKDIDALYKHHVLHSLALTRVIDFRPGSKILDLGTGGGFPGIPLAIAYPEVRFTLIDGTRKKITVVNEVAGALKLDNVTGIHTRVEDFKQGREQYDFVVTRAVTDLAQLWLWGNRMLAKETRHALPNGILAWKGGPRLKDELRGLHPSIYREVFPIRDFFKEEWFWEKSLVYMS